MHSYFLVRTVCLCERVRLMRRLLTSSFDSCWSSISFFFQAEDGIRDYKVTGVQTCALPICRQHGRLPARFDDRRTPLGAGPLGVGDAWVAGEGGRPVGGGGTGTGGRDTGSRVANRRRRGGSCGHGQIGRASWRERGWIERRR